MPVFLLRSPSASPLAGAAPDAPGPQRTGSLRVQPASDERNARLTEATAIRISEAAHDLASNDHLEVLQACSVIGVYAGISGAHRQHAHGAGAVALLLQQLRRCDDQITAAASAALTQLAADAHVRADIRTAGAVGLLLAYLQTAASLLGSASSAGQHFVEALGGSLECLAALARDDQGKIAVRDAGAVKQLLQLLAAQPSMVDVVLPCLNLLAQLCSIPAARIDLANAGAPHLLSSLLPHWGDARLHHAVLRVLIYIMIDNSTLAALRRTPALVPSLVRTLQQCRDADAGQLAAQMLAYLVPHASFREAMLRAGVVPALVALIPGDGSRPACKWALHTLCGLSDHAVPREEICKAGLVPELLAAAQDPDHACLELVLLTLANLSGCARAEQDVLSHGGVKVLLDQLARQAQPERQRDAIISLGQLSASPKIRAELYEQRGIPSLMRLALQAASPAMLALGVDLLACCAADESGAEELLALSGLQLFVQLLASNCAEAGACPNMDPLGQACVRGLAQLCVHCKDVPLIRSSGALYLLLQALHHSQNSSAQLHVLEALPSLCTNPEAAGDVVAAGTPALLARMLLLSTQPGTQDAAQQLLQALAQHASLSAALMRADVVPALVSRLQDAWIARDAAQLAVLCGTLHDLAQLPACQAAIVASGAATPLVVLVKHARGRSSVLGSAAVHAVVRLCQHPDNLVPLRQAGAPAALLQLFQGRHLTSVMRQGALALLPLLHGDPDAAQVVSSTDCVARVARLLMTAPDSGARLLLRQLLISMGQEADACVEAAVEAEQGGAWPATPTTPMSPGGNWFAPSPSTQRSCALGWAAGIREGGGGTQGRVEEQAAAERRAAVKEPTMQELSPRVACVQQQPQQALLMPEQDGPTPEPGASGGAAACSSLPSALPLLVLRSSSGSGLGCTSATAGIECAMPEQLEQGAPQVASESAAEEADASNDAGPAPAVEPAGAGSCPGTAAAAVEAPMSMLRGQHLVLATLRVNTLTGSLHIEPAAPGPSRADGTCGAEPCSSKQPEAASGANDDAAANVVPCNGDAASSSPTADLAAADAAAANAAAADAAAADVAAADAAVDDAVAADAAASADAAAADVAADAAAADEAAFADLDPAMTPDLAAAAAVEAAAALRRMFDPPASCTSADPADADEVEVGSEADSTAGDRAVEDDSVELSDPLADAAAASDAAAEAVGSPDLVDSGAVLVVGGGAAQDQPQEQPSGVSEEAASADGAPAGASAAEDTQPTASVASQLHSRRSSWESGGFGRPHAAWGSETATTCSLEPLVAQAANGGADAASTPVSTTLDAEPWQLARPLGRDERDALSVPPPLLDGAASCAVNGAAAAAPGALLAPPDLELGAYAALKEHLQQQLATEIASSLDRPSVLHTLESQAAPWDEHSAAESDPGAAVLAGPADAASAPCDAPEASCADPVQCAPPASGVPLLWRLSRSPRPSSAVSDGAATATSSCAAAAEGAAAVGAFDFAAAGADYESLASAPAGEPLELSYMPLEVELQPQPEVQPELQPQTELMPQPEAAQAPVDVRAAGQEPAEGLEAAAAAANASDPTEQAAPYGALALVAGLDFDSDVAAAILDCPVLRLGLTAAASAREQDEWLAGAEPPAWNDEEAPALSARQPGGSDKLAAAAPLPSLTTSTSRRERSVLRVLASVPAALGGLLRWRGDGARVERPALSPRSSVDSMGSSSSSSGSSAAQEQGAAGARLADKQPATDGSHWAIRLPAAPLMQDAEVWSPRRGRRDACGSPLPPE